MTTRPLSFFTVDRGTVATSAALIAPVDGRFRVLAAATVPRDADVEATLEDLVARVLAVDPGLLPEAADRSAWIRLEVATAPAPRVVCAAPSEEGLVRLERSFAAAGWEIAGSLTIGEDDALLAAEQLLDPLVPAVAVAAVSPDDDAERVALDRLGGLIASALSRRPALRVLSCGMPGDWDDRLPEGRSILLPAPGPGPVGRDHALVPILLDLAGRGRTGGVGVPDGRAAFHAAVASLAGLLDRGIEAVDIGHVAGSRVLAGGADPGAHLVTTRGALMPRELLRHEPSLEAIARWSTVRQDPYILHDRLRNLALTPWRDLGGDGPRLRAGALRGALERIDAAWQVAAAPVPPEAPPITLVSGGAFATLPAAAGLLAVADTMRRPGATTVFGDHARLLAPLGTVPGEDDRRRLLGDLLDDLLLPIGGIVLIPGLDLASRAGASVRVVSSLGEQLLELPAGGLQLVDLPPGVAGSIEVRVRTGRRGEPAEPVVLEVTGGLGGLLVDARPIPLDLPDRAERRRQLIEAWEQPVWGSVDG